MAEIAGQTGKIIRRVDLPMRPAKHSQAQVAAYVRVSSGKDVMLQSLSAQISHYSKLIQGNPEWNLVAIYVDEAMSGTKDNRAEFQKMLDDCRAGKIDMVITKSVTRFARNTLTTIEIVRELKLLGIDVYFEKEGIHSIDGSGELMLTILASFAQEESRSVSENCKWRVRKMFEAGRPNIGKLLGYRLVDGRFEIVPEEAEVVRKIFNQYLSGKGLNFIMRELIAEGAPTLRGGEWNEQAVHRILRNEKYAGDMMLQKTYVENHLSKRRMDNKGELPRYFVENSHEAIIDKATFRRTQDEMTRRRGLLVMTPHPPKLNAFSGLVKCADCGKSYHRKVASSGSKYEKAIWVCGTYNRFGKEACDAKRLSETILLGKTCEVLGTKIVTDLNDEAFSEIVGKQIRKVIVDSNGSLEFRLKNGETVTIPWQNPSRKNSWTPTMREAARQKTLKRLEDKKARDHE